MAHKPFRPPKDSATSQASAPFAGQGSLGTLLLLAGAGIAMLIVIDRTAGLPFEMPRTWYSTPLLWYFLAFVSFVSGMRLLRSAPLEDRRWQPDVQGQRFEKVTIYTREECHLCHQAKDVLWSYRKWLPEIEEVDITTSPHLMAKFSEQIPVVEIDGQIRFRGQVNEVLFRRLINATPPR
jgi:glutaredoxin